MIKEFYRNNNIVKSEEIYYEGESYIVIDIYSVSYCCSGEIKVVAKLERLEK